MSGRDHGGASPRNDIPPTIRPDMTNGIERPRLGTTPASPPTTPLRNPIPSSLDPLSLYCSRPALYLALYEHVRRMRGDHGDGSPMLPGIGDADQAAGRPARTQSLYRKYRPTSFD